MLLVCHVENCIGAESSGGREGINSEGDATTPVTDSPGSYHSNTTYKTERGQ